MNGIDTVIRGCTKPATLPTERQRQLRGIVALLDHRSLTARQVSLEMGMTFNQTKVLMRKLVLMGAVQVTHYTLTKKQAATPDGRPLTPTAVYRATR